MIASAQSVSASSQMPLTIAVTSGKGGVGKTSVTANLGAALAATGARVLLIDGDLGLANLDIVLGVEPKKTLADVLSGKSSIDEVIIETPSGASLLPASSGVSALVNLDDSKRADLLAVIESIERRYQYVLLDCAAGIGADVQLLTSVADEVFLVATPEPTSLTDAYATMKVLRKEHHRRRFRIIPTQVQGEAQARKVFGILSSVTDKYLDIELDLLGWLPFDDTWRHAILDRRLAFISHPNSAASEKAKELARRVLLLGAQNDERLGLGRMFFGGHR